ncbi:nuclear transport factor 2 family protein [Sphingobium sp. MK2]|uniref:nuclear transport factor 2 family protein n=1 Tax=Sphingobium sp. MK2 TaxID=3116540 RepID=UPI0032E35FF0
MTTATDLAIRLRRASFNRALAQADLRTIETLLARDAILVAGTDSAVLAGRKAQMLAWRREFAAAERLIYTRTPDKIITSAVEPIAMEHGQWQGVLASTGELQASGIYTAKWRQRGEDWLIEAEIYLTLA